MSARCGWCDMPNRRELEQRVLNGTPLRVVASDTAYSVAAAQRHIANHLRPQLLRHVQERTAAGLQVASFADRLLALAAETASVRAYAVEVNDPKLLLSAVQEEREVLGVLMARLGVTDLAVVDYFREAEAMATAVRDVVSAADPDVAHRLAEVLRQRGQRELSSAFTAIAERLTAPSATVTASDHATSRQELPV